MSHHFVPDQWHEFLEGGHVRTVHVEDVPIWAGFIITQLAELHAQIGVLLMTQAVSLHQMFQGDMTAIEQAFAQLVAANTAAKTTSQQLLTQIASLQAQLAAPDGDPVTSDDLTAMNSLAAQIQQAAASTITTAPTAPTSTPTAPATGTGSDSGAASAADSGSAAAPAATNAPAATAQAAASSTPASSTPSATTSSTPITSVSAGDAGSSK